MTIKLLAVLAEAATAHACLDAAEAAAQVLHDASIEALHVVVDPDYMMAASEEISLQKLRERFEGTARERELRTHEAYEVWAAQHPDADIPLFWQERFGCEEENVEQESRVFDVLVLARPTNMDGGDALDAAIYRSGRPFFLVPSKWRQLSGAGFARHVVLGCNGKPACIRALRGALPWLKKASVVTILLIEENRDVAREAAEILCQNVISFRVHQAARDGHSLGDQIVAEAHKLDADLLVIGAYRHNEFIEWLLGGTTRHLLAHFDLPLFLAH